MRYFEVIDEAIAVGPRDFGAYLRRRINLLDVLIPQMDKACALVRDNEREGEDMLQRYLSYGSDYHDHAYEIGRIISQAHIGWGDKPRLDDVLQLSLLHDNLKALLAHGLTFLKYITERSPPYRTLDAIDRGAMAILHAAEVGMEKYGADAEDPEHQAAVRLLRGLRAMALIVEQAEKLWTDIDHKLGVIAKRRASTSWGKEYRPEHEEVESLYHATAFAPEIVRDGFSAEKPIERQGLGQFGTQKEISFTYDLYIAKEIMRSLKEAWMIVHGQLKPKAIIGWMKAEGIDTTDRNKLSYIGAKREIPGEKDWDGNPRYRPAELHELSGPEETLLLYNVYLAHTKIRSNPVFSNIDRLIPIMQDRDVTDIGILQCEVRLDKDDVHLDGEKEFRVMSDRVQSIKRIM